MSSDNGIVRSINKDLVKGAWDLALTLAPFSETNEVRPAKVDQYRNAISKYVSSALLRPTAKKWVDSVGWTYAGIHIASELLPDYVSLTFRPGASCQDPSAGDYLSGNGAFSPFNFTRFLWPSETGLRDVFINPLEIVIESRTGEFVDPMQPFAVVPGSERFIPKVHRCEYSQQLQTVPTAIVVPFVLKEAFRSTTSYRQAESTLNRSAITQFCQSAKKYLQHNYYCGLETASSVSDEEIYEAVRNTMFLHKTTGLDPRAVTFFPLVCGSNRIGVFCFVTSEVPSEEESLRMQSLAETALHNIFGVDALLAKQRDQGIRKATLFLPLIAHEWRSGIATASLKLSNALRALHREQYEQVEPLLVRAKDLMRESQRFLEAFETAVYAEVKDTGSRVNPATLERQIRNLVSPEYVDKIHWIVSGDSYVEIPFQPDLLCYALWQMIYNAVEAVKDTSRRTESPWCIVEIVAENIDQLLINLKDIGPGFTPDQLESLNNTDFQPVQSSHRGGYGIKTTRWMIQGFGGTMDFDTGVEGTTWKIGIPSSRRLAIGRPSEGSDTVG
jgi:signal transduction histidine kinase